MTVIIVLIIVWSFWSTRFSFYCTVLC